MKFFLFTLVSFGLLAPSLARAESSPDDISAVIAAHGAKAEVNRLLESGDYEMVIKHISTGVKEWVDLAPQLKPGTDAAVSEELASALASALPKNAAEVLAVADIRPSSAISIKRICSLPFEGVDEDNKAVLQKYQKDAIAAVKSIGGQYPDAAALCMQHLKAWTYVEDK